MKKECLWILENDWKSFFLQQLILKLDIGGKGKNC